MSLKGIWRGESIVPGESNEQGRDIAVSCLLVVNHFDLLGELRGTLGYDPDQSGVEESAQVIGKVKPNLVQFVQMLPNFYYLQEDRKVGVAQMPHPEVFFEGRFMERDYLFGSWVRHKTYRLVEDKVIFLDEVSGSWWLKKIRNG